MNTTLELVLLAAPVAYLVALALYVRLLRAEDETPLRRGCRRASYVAAGLSTLAIALVSMEYGRCPLTTRGEALLFSAWLLTLFHLFYERYAKTQSLGAFTIAPAILFLLVGELSRSGSASPPAADGSALFVAHIAASLAAYVSYAMSALMAIMYLVLHRRLKRKRFDLTFRKMPSLESLDRMAAVWAFSGSISLILALVGGARWYRGQAEIELTTSLLPLILVLIIFLASAGARRALGWRGLRHIVIILVGYGCLIAASALSFLNIHGFYSG